jgi:hypothetical protein
MVSPGCDRGGDPLSEPTPRQVLYALVAAGFIVVVAVLVIGGALAGLVPGWWTGVMSMAVGIFAIWGVANWREIVPVLSGSILLFIAWTVGTLILV